MSKPTWIIDRKHPFDSIATMKMLKSDLLRRKKLTLTLHKTWMDYMLHNIDDHTEKEQILKDIASQQLERYLMRTMKDHPFYGDENGFEHYCRVKYPRLYQHILRMIDMLEADRREGGVT